MISNFISFLSSLKQEMNTVVSVFLKLHVLFLIHSRLLDLLRLCARFITLKSSKMSSIMETKRVKTSLEDSLKSWINLNIMSWMRQTLSLKTEDEFSLTHFLPNTITFVKGKKVFNEQKCSLFFFLVFSFFNLFGFSLGLFSVSLTNPRIMTQAGVSGKSLTFKTDPEFLC